MPRERIQRRKLHHEVAERIEAQIHAGHYAEGDRLPSERELMERYGVGRPAVREALLSLEKMGLIAIRSGERAQVTAPSAEHLFGQLSGAARRFLATAEGVRHFQQARLLFEAALARHAAMHALPEDLTALEHALKANRATIGNRYEFERTDHAFHHEIAALPGNPIFTELQRALINWLTEQRQVTLSNPGADREAYEYHLRIFEAIKARDPDAAERAMQAHLERVEELYWKTVGKDGPLRDRG